MYIDTHFHLFLADYDPINQSAFDPKEVVEESIQAGVKEMWLSSSRKEDIQQNLDICNDYSDSLRMFVGMHPEEYEEFDKGFLEGFLEKHLSHKFETRNSKSEKGNSSNSDIRISGLPIIGVGEIGVDLNYHSRDTLSDQQEVFEEQIRLAKKYNLPICVHSRDAYEETKEVLDAHGDIKFIWHCYNLDREKTEVLLNEFDNIYFGFNNIITYNSGGYIKESIKVIPLEKILPETDAPFLRPRTWKYDYNTPEGVIPVYAQIAGYKNISMNKLRGQIINNINEYRKGI